jgi:PIN domain nuclease of toxin-antitoxin system
VRYLLDTHTLLWSRLEPSKLPSVHRQILSDAGTIKAISTVSIWEISLKFALGKLELGGHTPEEFLSTAVHIGFEVVAPLPEHLASFHNLSAVPGHKDPFDRLLIWQAIQNNLTFLSSDNRMASYRPRGLNLA